MGDRQSMVVLKAGDWVKFSVGDDQLVGQIRDFMGKSIFVCTLDGSIYTRYSNELTRLPKGLNPILSDSISKGE